MALALKNFVGFETGGLEEAKAVAGTPEVVESNVRSGDYCLLMNAAADQYEIDTWRLNLQGLLLGIGFRADDATPASMRTLIELYTSDDDLELSVKLNTDGKIRLSVVKNGIDYDGTTVLTDGDWHYLEIAFEWSPPPNGGVQLWVNNAVLAEIDVTNIDARAGTTGLGYWRLLGAPENFRFDDAYTGNPTFRSDPPYDPPEVFKYQSVKASDTPDNGSVLDAGTWDKAGETPLAATATNPEYESTGAGSVNTDDVNGFPEGPKNDARIDGDSNIKAMKGISNMKRAGGGGTAHYILMGNDVDGTTRSADLDPTTSFLNYFFFSELASIVPLSTEYCSIGFEMTNAQDYECQEQWAMLLHVPSAVVVGPDEMMAAIGQQTGGGGGSGDIMAHSRKPPEAIAY